MREEGQLAEQLQRRGEERGIAAVERVVEEELERGEESGEIQRHGLLEIAGRDEKLLAVEQLREEEMERADGDGTKAERVERILVVAAMAAGSIAAKTNIAAAAAAGCAVGKHREKRAVAPEKGPDRAGSLRLHEAMRMRDGGRERGRGGEPSLHRNRGKGETVW